MNIRVWPSLTGALGAQKGLLPQVFGAGDVAGRAGGAQEGMAEFVSPAHLAAPNHASGMNGSDHRRDHDGGRSRSKTNRSSARRNRVWSGTEHCLWLARLDLPDRVPRKRILPAPGPLHECSRSADLNVYTNAPSLPPVSLPSFTW